MLRLQFKIRYGTNGPNHFIPLLHFHSFVEEGERYPSDWEPLAKLGWSNLNFAPISWHTFLNCSPAPHTSNKRKRLQNYSSVLIFVFQFDFHRKGEMLKRRFFHLKRKEESQTKAANWKREVDCEFDQDHTRLMYEKLKNPTPSKTIQMYEKLRNPARKKAHIPVRHILPWSLGFEMYRWSLQRSK